jgi:hypothetical protein
MQNSIVSQPFKKFIYLFFCFLFSFLILDCVNLKPEKKKDKITDIGFDGDWPYAFGVLLGCAFPNPDTCSDASWSSSNFLGAVELYDLENNKSCGGLSAKTDTFIYTQAGKIKGNELLQVPLELQCKYLDSQSRISTGTYSWYLIDAENSKKGKLLFTHTVSPDNQTTNIFSYTETGKSLVCCRNILISSNCKPSYNRIVCEKITTM